jgi:hypothetical protein
VIAKRTALIAVGHDPMLVEINRTILCAGVVMRLQRQLIERLQFSPATASAPTIRAASVTRVLSAVKCARLPVVWPFKAEPTLLAIVVPIYYDSFLRPALQRRRTIIFSWVMSCMV